MDYDIGDEILLSATFRDADTLALTDPENVFIKVQKPDTTSEIFQYNVDPELGRLSQGAYTLFYLPDQSGTWRYRWYTTGTLKVAEEGVFYVRFKTVV